MPKGIFAEVFVKLSPTECEGVGGRVCRGIEPLSKAKTDTASPYSMTLLM